MVSLGARQLGGAVIPVNSPWVAGRMLGAVPYRPGRSHQVVLPGTATLTQTIGESDVLSGTVYWHAVFSFLGDGADDDPGLITFYVDGIAVLTELNQPFGDTLGFWDSSSVADGTHTFTVSAFDPAGNLIISNSVTADTDNGGVSGGSDPLQWGYRPAAPAGWEYVSNKNLTYADVQGVSNKYFYNCRAYWISATPRSSNLIFVNCDCRGGMGKYGDHIWFFGCRFGERIDGDGCQTSGEGSVQSTDFWFQGCTFRDITRTPGSGFHTDGMEIYGLNGSVVRYCYFDNIAIETILVQPNQANQCNNNNILIERNYFGPNRPEAGGCDVKFADAGTVGNVGPCISRENYGGSTCLDNYPYTAAYAANYAEPHQSRSAWPYPLLRADGWLDY